MNKLFLHIKTIFKHKYAVFLACKDCGILWRGLKHDLSKLSFIELLSYKYSNGCQSPIDIEKKEKGYSLGWQHHKGHNTHHWEYWMDTNVNNIGKLVPIRIPYKDAVEIICDYIGAGKAYNNKTWSDSTPLNYWTNNKNKMIYHSDTAQFLEKIFIMINDIGWKKTSIYLKQNSNY